MWERRSERYRRRAEAAEALLEDKARELYVANEDLLLLARDLEQRVVDRTTELEDARDEALAASRAKSTFLANMSHELRTPLNAITGYAELLAEEAFDRDLLEFTQDLGRIQDSAIHLLTLISEVLDLSKVEAGRLDLDFHDVDVHSLVTQALEVVRPRVQTGVELDHRIDAGVGRVRADPFRLQQCLLNLLSNAVKFTRSGAVHLEVRRVETRVRIEVTDTGIGLTEAEAGRLFETFHQANNEIRKTFGGTGLGLALSRQLMEKMKGRAWLVRSAINEGSTFALEIPAAGDQGA